MPAAPIELYNDGKHQCLMFDSLVTGDGVQSNQFLIIDDDQSALIDPGGDLTFTPLQIAASRYVDLHKLTYVLASHQDPDIIAALDRWLVHSGCKVVTSKLWARFLPHLASAHVSRNLNINVYERITPIPDEGLTLRLGNATIQCVPAHFLHSVGNFHFYDPVARILFSGDMGASMGDGQDPVEDFDRHIPYMLGFHRRYMASNKACRLWANAVRHMDVEMIVPQHGRPFKGKAMVGRFLDWASELRCGLDLMTEENYMPPPHLP